MTDIKADVWFASLVWQTSLDIDTTPLKDLSYTLQRQGNSVELTNQGGWQSTSLALETPEMRHFVSVLEGVVDQCCASVELPKLRFQNAWLNINPKGAYNTLHNHHGGILSGVYYIEANEDMGAIEFLRDDDMQYYMPGLKKYNQFSSQKAVYKPLTGKLLIFPSWLKHQVLMNNTENDRISLSFNYGA